MVLRKACFCSGMERPSRPQQTASDPVSGLLVGQIKPMLSSIPRVGELHFSYHIKPPPQSTVSSFIVNVCVVLCDSLGAHVLQMRATCSTMVLSSPAA